MILKRLGLTGTNYKFARAEVRVPTIELEIAGIIQSLDLDRPIACKLWDVTSLGIGILSDQSLRPGQLVVANFALLPALHVQCRVAWCAPLKGADPLYRVGLYCNGDASQNFSELVRLVED